MSQLKKLAGQTAIYGLSSILGRSINFLLIIVYTAYLTKADLGAFTGIYALIGFLNIVFTYGMETAFFRFSTGKNQDPGRVYQTSQSLLLLSTAVLGTVVYLAAPLLAQAMNYEGQAYLFRWTAILLSFDAVLAIPFAKLRLENKAVTFAGAKLANILLNVFFNLFFLIWMPQGIESGLLPAELLAFPSHWGVEYILLANLLANGLIIPLVWWKAGFFSFTLQKDILKPMWAYSLPLLFMGLAGVTNELISRLLFEYVLPLQYYAGLTAREAAGIFGANFKLAILMNLVIQAFKYAAEPFFFRQAKEADSPQRYAQVMHAFVLFCALLMVAISVNLHWIGPLFLKGEAYAIGFSMVPMLLLGYLLLGIYFNLSIWFKLTDQTSYSLWITLLGAGVSSAGILLLVPIWGFMGAAVSTVACYLVMAGVCYRYGQLYYPIPYQTGKGLFFLLLAFTLSYAGYYLSTGTFWMDFFVKNTAILIFLATVAGVERSVLLRLLGKKT
jgi:O-antigen/teichoic acid export membrane protein